MHRSSDRSSIWVVFSLKQGKKYRMGHIGFIPSRIDRATLKGGELEFDDLAIHLT